MIDRAPSQPLSWQISGQWIRGDLSGEPDHYPQWTKEPAESRPTEQALADQGEVDEKASNEASAKLLRLIICESCGILPDTSLLILHSPSSKEK